MADRSAAERACKDPNPIIDGRKANVNLAYLGAKPRILPGRTLPGYNSQTFSPAHRRRLFILCTGANSHRRPGFWVGGSDVIFPNGVRVTGWMGIFCFFLQLPGGSREI